MYPSKQKVFMMNRKRQKSYRCGEYVISYLSKYCRSSSLHGLQYIAEGNWLERLFWSALCFCGFLFMVALSFIAVNGYNRNPTITSVETTSHPIWDIHFPGVTLCNSNKVYAPAAEKILDKLIQKKGVSRDESMHALRLLPHLLHPGRLSNQAALRARKVLSREDITDTMRQVMQPCDKMIVKCEWQGKERECDQLFRAVISAEGYCCGFNSLALKEYASSNDPPEIFRTESAGLGSGLTVILKAEPQFYTAVQYPFYGITVLVHDSLDYPEISIHRVHAVLGEEVSVNLNARVIESIDDVRRVDPADRQCWFDNEVRTLDWTDEYSHQTCMSECRRDWLLNHCGCAPFYYPKYKDNKTTCGFEDVNCIFRSIAGLNALKYYGNNGSCNCLPQCSDKSYSVIAEKTKIMDELNYGSFFFPEEQNSSDIILLHVFFRDISCIKYRRTVYMTWDGLLATIGGIVGLCMGGSLLSLLEIIYCFILKPCISTCCKNKQVEPKKGAQPTLKFFHSRENFNQYFINHPNTYYN